jgi:hypothetical protein
MKFVIEDWAGNRLSAHGEFPSFEDAWEYIREHWPNEDDWQELYVVPSKEKDE